MPLWVSAYLAAYVTFTLWSLADDLKKKKGPLRFIAAEIVSDLCLVTSALTFWISDVRTALGQINAVVFLVGVALFAVQAVRAFHRNVIADQELPLQGKVFVGLTGSALVVAFSAPLLLWGFWSVFLGRNAGT